MSEWPTIQPCKDSKGICSHYPSITKSILMSRITERARYGK
jgi:hypothetical protein